jgi:uncharacterized membrane protein YdbT with pleckstrin-like domain
MGEIVIRPSAKLIQIAYTFVVVVIFVCILLYVNTPSLREISPWVLAIPALLLLWPLRYDMLRRFTRMTLSGDTLRYETGVLSRSKRNIQISKVQDVRVDQTLSQRMFRMGNLSIETAGETSQLTMRNVDNPDQVADEILRISRGQASGGPARGL